MECWKCHSKIFFEKKGSFKRVNHYDHLIEDYQISHKESTSLTIETDNGVH